MTNENKRNSVRSELLVLTRTNRDFDGVRGRGFLCDADLRYQQFQSSRAALQGPFDWTCPQHPRIDSGNLPAGGGVSAESNPDVAALSGGGFVVVWTDADTGDEDIRAALYTNDGIFNDSSDIPVNETTTGFQNEASVTGLADGGFLVTWEDDTASLMRAQRFDATGNKAGTRRRLMRPCKHGGKQLHALMCWEHIDGGEHV